MKNRAFIGVLIIVLALVGLGAFLFWRARTPPVVTRAVPFRSAPPAEQERRRAEAQKLVEDVGAVAQAARRKEHKPFRVVATEEQLNTLLQDRIDTSHFPIRDLTLGLKPGRIAAQGTASYSGVETVVTVEGAVQVEDGRLRYQVDSLKLGGLPAPAKLKDKVEREVSQQLNRGLKHAPGQIKTVTVEDGELVVEGVTE
jgi:hypothetical protein